MTVGKLREMTKDLADDVEVRVDFNVQTDLEEGDFVFGEVTAAFEGGCETPLFIIQAEQLL